MWQFVQAQGSTLGRVTLKVVAIYSTHDASNESEDYRYNFWIGNNSYSCLKVDQKVHHQWIATNYNLYTNKEISLNEPITIEAKAWEEDGCDGDCSYDGGCVNSDEGVCNRGAGVIDTYSPGGSSISIPRGSTEFTLASVPPGNRADNLIEMWFCGGKYRIHLLVTYTPPQPSSPTIRVDNEPYPDASSKSYLLCDESEILLTTATTLSSAYTSQVQYVWEYNIKGDTRVVYDPNPAYCGDLAECNGTGPGPLPNQNLLPKKSAQSTPVVNAALPGDGPPPCCYEPPYIERTEDVWRGIRTTSKIAEGDVIRFNPRTLQGLANITSNKSFFVRVKVLTNSLSSPYIATETQINISPPGPVIGSIYTSPSCPNTSTGKIHVSDISGLGEYYYIYKAGFGNTEPCDPQTDGCFKGNWGTGTDHIEGVNFGDHTFWLVNTGGTRGSCYTTKDITVDRIPDLAVTVSNLNHVTCNGSSNGAVILDKTGGAAPYNFTLSDPGGPVTNSSGSFSSLSAGKYIASVSDGCGQVSEQTSGEIIVKQPVKLSESLFNAEKATCINPGNGILNATVFKSSGAYDTIVSSTFSFKLLKDGVQYGTVYKSTSPTWNRNDLPVGDNYQLVVTETGSAECNGYTKSFAIVTPDPLNLAVSNTGNVSCFGQSDGTLALNGTGGSGLFLFKISKTAGDTLSGTSGNFSGLSAGTYGVVIENDLPGCHDKANYASTLTISQPDPIAIELNKNNISCFGAQNGNIAATVSGGTPAYSYTWEKQNGAAWSTTGTNIPALSGLAQGTFRLKITDNNTCINTSGAVSIVEPSVLSTAFVQVHDIQCFGEPGIIDIQSAGGTLPYVYSYARNGDLNFSPLVSGVTALTAGNYVLKTVDGNGCSFTAPGVYAITTPVSALDLAYQKSDYNGFNISCFGGSNGYLDLNATGGNGGSYSGYAYSLDNGAYQAANRINGINAGQHVISVIDGRGCVASKTINFTQTTDVLTLQLVNKQDVICVGDLSGSIEVNGVGGLSPYQFNINASGYQSSPIFPNLSAGDYAIEMIDVNGCLASKNISIQSVNPAIQLQSTVKNVNCFGGNDGEIDVLVTDGVYPFQYSWTGQSGNSQALHNLIAGSYVLTVTDDVGCRKENSFTVQQPLSALSVSIAATPICFGMSNGAITLLAKGGTAPYQYSIDDGATYQISNSFNTVGIGNYTINVKDNNQCLTTGTTSIVQRNDRPEPNFLVSTRQNALDTLVITEISVPKPDSISWIFDPQAILIKDDSWSPQVKFNNAGVYFISMIGFFGGCEYSLTKNLTLNPYDPNATPAKETAYRTIESLDVSPNPSNGEFDLKVKLTRKSNISIVIYNLMGTSYFSDSWEETKELNQKVKLPLPPSGIYLLRVITDTDARDVRIIISQ